MTWFALIRLLFFEFLFERFDVLLVSTSLGFLLLAHLILCLDVLHRLDKFLG